MMTGEFLSSPEIGELAKAMVKVQQALAPVCKDAENPFVKSRYATLNAVIDACRYGLATLVGLVSETDDDGEASLPTRTHAKAADKTKPPAMAQPDAPAGLPKIDGIDYQTIAASNGKTCVIATGNARDKRPLLEQAGFRWDGSRKVWRRYAA